MRRRTIHGARSLPDERIHKILAELGFNFRDPIGFRWVGEDCEFQQPPAANMHTMPINVPVDDPRPLVVVEIESGFVREVYSDANLRVVLVDWGDGDNREFTSEVKPLASTSQMSSGLRSQVAKAGTGGS